MFYSGLNQGYTKDEEIERTKVIMKQLNITNEQELTNLYSKT